MKTIFSYIMMVILIFSLTLGVFAKDYSNYKLGLKQEKLSKLKSSFKSAKTKLSTKVDLTSLMPPVGDQGQQGSCTAWAVGYAAKSMQEGLDQNWALNTRSHLFSPAFIYNQINGGVDGGAYISSALDVIMYQGCATLDKSPYNQNDYWTQPSQAARNQASHYKALTWMNTTNYGDVNATKNIIDEHRTPAVVGIAVGTDLFQLNNSTNKVYDTLDYSHGGHAITLVGYDDNYPVKTKTVTIPRKVKYDKYIKPTSKIVGSQWYVTVKVGNKNIKKGQTLTTDSASYYIKVREDDPTYDDIKIVKGNLKYGTNKIAVKVTENGGKYKEKSVTWYFYLTRTQKKTVTTVTEKGAFKLQNSWGTGWGQSGFGWISYKLFADSKFNAALPAYGYMLEDIEEDYEE